MKSFIYTVLAFLSFSSFTAFAQTYYPITCRGGPQSSFNKNVSDELSFSFVKSARPAPQGLNPGECSWQDRPLNGNEPATLFITLGGNKFGVVIPHKDNFSFRPYMYLGNGDWLFKLTQTSEPITFMVYNDGQYLRGYKQ